VSGAHVTVAFDTSTLPNSRGAGHSQEQPAAVTVRPYVNAMLDDNTRVDAASHGRPHGNGAHGGSGLADAATRLASAGNGTRNGSHNGVHSSIHNGAERTAVATLDRADANGAPTNGHGDHSDHGGHDGHSDHGSRGDYGSHPDRGDHDSHDNHGGKPAGGGTTPAPNGTHAFRNGNGARTNGHGRNGHAGVRFGEDGLGGLGPGGVGHSENGHSVTFGFGETAGVLPGDQRTFDDVEAGIVALWRQFGERREQPLRDRLVLHYAPLVKYVAGRVGTGLPAHVEVADLIQSGIFGLVDAIEKFEPERGLKFETYAMQRIRGAILDDLRAQDWVPRSVRGRAREVERALERLGAQLRRTPTDAELADELGLSLHELRDVYAQLQLTSVVALDELAAAGRGPTPLADILEDQEALDPVALLVDQDNRRQLAQAIAHLAERDRVVVTLYYFENLTLAEIGRVLGVTESRVCQLHTRAVLRLRAKLLEKSDA
jgi:RNA polymerase sigma factor for flagellar operon FliA